MAAKFVTWCAVAVTVGLFIAVSETNGQFFKRVSSAAESTGGLKYDDRTFQPEPEDAAGNESLPIPAIVDGYPVARNAYPFIVSLQRKYDGHHFCGGVIISARHILTAAHCIQGAYGVNKLASSIRVGVGLQYKSEATSDNFYSVNDIDVHYAYNRHTDINDIALLTLDERITTHSGRVADTIDLPSSENSNPRPGSKVIAIGWGMYENFDNDYYGRKPDGLRGAVFEVLDEDDCARREGKLFMPDSKICVDSSSTAVCKGDSGGPLFRQKSFTTYELVGLASYVLGGNCRVYGSANVFTRVSQFRFWIRLWTGIDF